MIATYQNFSFQNENQFPKFLRICPGCTNLVFRKKCNQQQQLHLMRKKLSGVNFFLDPSMQWVRWVQSGFENIHTVLLGFSRFKKDAYQVFGVLSLPCSILCYIGVAIFSPAIALAQFLGALLACFAALGVRSTFWSKHLTEISP